MYGLESIRILNAKRAAEMVREAEEKLAHEITAGKAELAAMEEEAKQAEYERERHRCLCG